MGNCFVFDSTIDIPVGAEATLTDARGPHSRQTVPGSRADTRGGRAVGVLVVWQSPWWPPGTP